MAVEAYLLERHVSWITWHTVLNNHASQRPKAHGGALVDSVTACKEFTPPGPSCAEWRCTLTLPNSFAPGDGRRVEVTGEGTSKDAAGELACLRAVAELISESPQNFVLRPKHWMVSPDELVAHLPGGAFAGHQALPVHTRARNRDAGAEANMDDAEARVAELLQRCLHAHGGVFDPSAVSHKRMGLGPQDERVYDKLNKLLKTGQLRAFIDKHPAFTWSPKGQKGMLVTWAHGPQRPAVDDVPALEAGALEESVRTPGFASASGADLVTHARMYDLTGKR